MAGRKSFREILSSVEERNSNILMGRAKTANLIAKHVRGTNKRNAYAVKHRALTSLVEKLPRHAFVRTDWHLADFLVVGLANSRSGLHIPSDLIGV